MDDHPNQQTPQSYATFPPPSNSGSYAFHETSRERTGKVDMVPTNVRVTTGAVTPSASQQRKENYSFRELQIKQRLLPRVTVKSKVSTAVVLMTLTVLIRRAITVPWNINLLTIGVKTTTPKTKNGQWPAKLSNILAPLETMGTPNKRHLMPTVMTRTRTVFKKLKTLTVSAPLTGVVGRLARSPRGAYPPSSPYVITRIAFRKVKNSERPTVVVT